MSDDDSAPVIAFAGNAFITYLGSGDDVTINEDGLVNWQHPDTICSAYFRMNSSGSVAIRLIAYLVGSKNSTVRVTINNTPYTVHLAGLTAKPYPVDTVKVSAPGYVRVDIQGVSKDGTEFGNIWGLGVTTTCSLTFANDDRNYYWSRRGASVHMRYDVPADTEYFYNEVTVPVEEDPAASFFMVTGFDGGHCGLHVKDDERWVLFHVGDTGQNISVVSKGEGVQFVSGGQEAGLEFDWTAGTTYKFITRVRPDGSGNTLYSAWFYAPEIDAWCYLATFKRPATHMYHRGVHSYLQNRAAVRGFQSRRVFFGNQWALSAGGDWSEVTTARYTGDATAINEQRMDYAGGLGRNGRAFHFYLRSGGFFAEYVKLEANRTFHRPSTRAQRPTVDVDTLRLR